jgi:hypothetical protein
VGDRRERVLGGEGHAQLARGQPEHGAQMHLERLGLAVAELERHIFDSIPRIQEQSMGIEQPNQHHHRTGRRQPHLGEPAFARPSREPGALGQGGHGGPIARRVEHGLERVVQLGRQLAEGRLQGLHDLLGSALLQLVENGGPQGPRRILEAMDDDFPDSRAAELEQHTRIGRRQVGIDQQRKRREELPQPLDPVGPRLAASEERIHHRHVHRLPPDRFHGLRPAAGRRPLEPVGIQGA